MRPVVGRARVRDRIPGLPTTTTSAAESLWLATAPASAHPQLDRELHVDVAVIGGGIAGITTALLLKHSGARVAVLEAHTVGAGTTGCTTAKVTALQATLLSTIRGRNGDDAAATYAEASLAAVDKVAELAAAEGVECDLERRPAYTYAADESELGSVEGELEAARRAGLAVERVDGPDLPFPTAGAVRL